MFCVAPTLPWCGHGEIVWAERPLRAWRCEEFVQVPFVRAGEKWPDMHAFPCAHAHDHRGPHRALVVWEGEPQAWLRAAMQLVAVMDETP